MRTELSYPARIKKIGNAFYINIPKEYVESLGAADGTEIDVHVKLVGISEEE